MASLTKGTPRVGRSERLGARWPGLVFVAPAVAVVGLFLAYPIYRTVRLSFYDWDGLAPSWLPVGFANFGELFHRDPYFWDAVGNTAIWAVVTVPVELGLGLALALMLDRKIRFRVGFRTIFFLPAALSPVVIGLAWNSLYTPERGAVSRIVAFLGFNGHRGWLGDPSLALPAAMIASVWRYTGLMMLFYLAALQTIPPSLHEAARVDGASEWTQIRRITLSLLKPMTALLALLATIAALREFDLVYILTAGGPAHASDLLSIQIFNQGFTLSRVGYSSAIATLMLAATAIVAILQLGYLARVHRRLS